MRKSFILIALLLLSYCSSSIYAQTDSILKERSQAVIKLENLLTIINYAYVDEVDNSKMAEDAIVGLLKGLDPHSVYIPVKELQKMNEPLEGNFEGVGIQFNILHDTITVISPISGGPSERVGILPGDRIVTVDGKNVAGNGVTNNDVQELLRGKKGTVVNIQVDRYGEKKLLDFSITRAKIPIYSIDASYMATDEIGYIKLNRFARESVTEFRQAIDTLKRDGATSLILDLRGNGGGYLNTAFLLADEFLDKDKMIVYTEGDKQRREEFKATSRGNFKDGKLVILIDEGSASASEIVAGAVQDWDRGLVLGRRSFGKGLVQKPFPLPDGSVVRLTTAEYYTPTGRSIQRPYNKGKEEYYNEINRRLSEGELFKADNIDFPDSLKYYTPNKRIVYGGGGIMPDIFIPLDTTIYSNLNSTLIRKGVFNEFSIVHLDKNRKKYKSTYPTSIDFQENFTVSEEIMKEFFELAKKKEVEENEEDYQTSKELIHLQIKALLARDLYNSSAYFQIINTISDTYKEAVNLLESDEYMKAKLEHD